MRILHVIYDDTENPWLGGGGATRTYEIYSRIAAQGHTVVVACGAYPGAPLRRVRDGIRYRYLGLRSGYVASRISFVTGAIRLIKQGGYDIVCEDVTPYSPVCAPLWSGGLPAVASVQNLSGVHASSKYGLAGWGPRLAEGPMLSRFKNFIAVSPGIAEALRGRLGQSINVEVIPNSAGELFASADRKSETGDYFLFLGRIDLYQKGLDRLVAAFGTVGERLPLHRLIIAGGGPDKEMAALSKLVEDSPAAARIDILGQVDRSRAAELLAGAALLAMPSRYEAWPLSAIEAAAAGVPVVGSDVVGVRDAAPAYPQANGMLVPEGDIEALAGAMCRVAADRALAARIGEAGRKWAGQFTWDALSARQLAFFGEIMAASRGAGHSPHA